MSTAILMSLCVRISSIPLSKSIRASELRILLFDDQSELLTTLKKSEQSQCSFSVEPHWYVLVLMFAVTSTSFNRILESDFRAGADG